MQSLAGWIGTVYRTVLVGSMAVDGLPQKQEDGDAALAIDTVMKVDPSNDNRLRGSVLNVGRMALLFRQEENALCAKRSELWLPRSVSLSLSQCILGCDLHLCKTQNSLGT